LTGLFVSNELPPIEPLLGDLGFVALDLIVRVCAVLFGAVVWIEL